MLNNEVNHSKPIVEVDQQAGFCFGVVNAIKKAEELLKGQSDFYCLGNIVHNQAEVQRLEKAGMKVLPLQKLSEVKDSVVLFRAHGEPPLSYELAQKNNSVVVDGTCPVVLKLQSRVKQAGERMKAIGGQLIIFGKANHPEVLGLIGQTDHKILVIEDLSQFGIYNPEKEAEIFAQTTSNQEQYKKFGDYVAGIAKAPFKFNDTICRQVSGRAAKMEDFGKRYDVVVFVGGRESSNAKQLFKVVLQHNPESYFVETAAELQPDWFKNAHKIGVTGATSTPNWLMEQVAADIVLMADSQSIGKA